MFGADPEHLSTSREALRHSMTEGALLASEIVWAEVGAFFASPEKAADSLERVGIAFDPLSREAARAASAAWRRYRRRGGSRTRVIADFLIGAHAIQRADRLLTRDRGFYRAYFRGLRVLDPSRS